MIFAYYSWGAHDTNDGIEAVWSVIKLSRTPPIERKRVKTEVELSKDIQHKNVIRYYNSWIDREKEQIIFVTEKMSSRSLKTTHRLNLHPTPIGRNNSVISSSDQSSQSQSITIPSSSLK
jgi:serine/threonine protein kinase